METKKFLCKLCGYDTDTKFCLISHLQKKNICSNNQDISREDLLKELTEKQYNDITYDCEYCGKKFNDNSNKYKHRKICKQKPEDTNNIPVTQEDTSFLPNNNEINEMRMEINELKYTVRELRNIVNNNMFEIRNSLSSLRNRSTVVEQKGQDTTEAPKKKKKQKISRALKVKCWDTYIGVNIGKAKCLCCSHSDITQHNFECGHVIAESKGGTLDISNLRPICNVCNSSMGTTNMEEFREEQFK
jgi:uncharacterized protein VirK/YbjX